MFEYIKKAKDFARLCPEHYPEIAERILDETINYDEAQVPEYTLPSALDVVQGRRVKNAMDWETFGRPAALRLFQREMYGRILPRPDQESFEVLSVKEDALDGTAIRKEIRLHFAMNNGRCFYFDALIYIPRTALEKPVPAFVGLNFKGNHVTTLEQDVRRTGLRLKNPEFEKESTPGSQEHRWYFKDMIRHGYASMTACYHDIFPDRVNGWSESALSLFEDNLEGFADAHEHYTSIGVWAWGLSRMMDYLESERLVDAGRVAVHGHSRLGKTALWAGACDRRFGMVISNCSGCGGAALSRRVYGETFLHIHNAMPHWFVKPFRKYQANEESLPFDQHWLVALAAPRPVAIASATEDQWADPKGEFLSAKYAQEVYRLYGSEGIPAQEHPKPGVYVSGDISYHYREGIHDQTPFDYEHYLMLADKYLR